MFARKNRPTQLGGLSGLPDAPTAPLKQYACPYVTTKQPSHRSVWASFASHIVFPLKTDPRASTGVGV